MNGHSAGRESSGSGTNTARLFAAVELPDALRSQLAELKKDFPGLRWMVPENMHITLRFIGEVDGQKSDKAQSALREVRLAPFSLHVQGLGLFEMRHQSVLWAGVQTSASLLELKRQVDGVLAWGIGLDVERGRFTPHITLSRIRTGVSAALREQIECCRYTGKSFVAESFTLFHSVLSFAGAAHSPLERYPLVAPGT